MGILTPELGFSVGLPGAVTVGTPAEGTDSEVGTALIDGIEPEVGTASLVGMAPAFGAVSEVGVPRPPVGMPPLLPVIVGTGTAKSCNLRGVGMSYWAVGRGVGARYTSVDS